MSPSPNQNPRYRTGMPDQPGMGQVPAGGPPSYTGGTPSGSQPAGAGMQQRMPAPWMQQGANPPEGSGNAVQPPMQSELRGGGPIDGPVPNVPPQGGAPGRMPPPWMLGGGDSRAPLNSPSAGVAPGQRPQYQGAPGPMQRSQMSGSQAPGSPMSQRQMNQRQPGM